MTQEHKLRLPFGREPRLLALRSLRSLCVVLTINQPRRGCADFLNQVEWFA